MNMDDNQKKKYIILGILVLVALIVVIPRVSSMFGRPGPKGQTTSKVTAKAGADSGQGSIAISNQAGGEDIDAAAGYVVGQPRDPFAPQVVAASRIQNQNMNSSVANGRTQGGNIKPMPMPTIEPFPIQTGPSGSPGFEENPAAQLKLTGVIQGSVNMAIIRGEGKTRYIVREGQIIDGRYTVESITKFGVWLKNLFDHSIFFLKLGGNDATENGTS